MRRDLGTIYTKAVLGRTCDLLEQRGWTQRTWAADADGCVVPVQADDATCFCLVGALRRAVSDLIGVNVVSVAGPAVDDATIDFAGNVYVRARFHLDTIVRRLPSWSGGAAVDWNDADGRTAADVRRVARKAYEAV